MLREQYVEAVFACGGSGMLRMNAPGEENFFGYASVDTSGIPPITMDLLLCKPFRLSEMPNAFGRSAPCFPSIWGSMLKGIIRIGHRCTGVARPIRSPARFVGHMPCALRDFEQTTAALKPGAVPAEIWAEACAVAQREGQMDGFMGLGRDKVPFLGHGICSTVDETPVCQRLYRSARTGHGCGH